MPEETAPDARWVRLKLTVDIFEAKPNPMFTEEQTALVRFLRYSHAVPCAECGKRNKHHWTNLCSFQAFSMAQFVPKKSGKVHMPLTPVCRGHILAAEVVETEPPKEGAE